MIPEKSFRDVLSLMLKKHGFSLIEKKEDLYNSRYIWKNFETAELLILEMNIDYEEYFKEENIINE